MTQYSFPDPMQDPAFRAGYESLGTPEQQPVEEQIFPPQQQTDDEEYDSILRGLVNANGHLDDTSFRQVAFTQGRSTKFDEKQLADDAAIYRDAYNAVYKASTPGAVDVMRKYTGEDNDRFVRTLNYVQQRKQAGLDKDWQRTSKQNLAEQTGESFERGLYQMIYRPAEMLARALSYVAPEEFGTTAKGISLLNRINEAQGAAAQGERGVVNRGFQGAVGMAPMMLGAMALGGAGSAGTTAGLGSRLLSAATSSPSLLYWTSQAQPGMQRRLEDEGVSSTTAAAFSVPTALLSASLEAVGMEFIGVPFKSALINSWTKGIASKIAQRATTGLLGSGAAFAGEVLTEGMQGFVEELGSQGALAASGRGFDLGSVMNNAWQNTVEAAISMPWLMLPGASINKIAQIRAKNRLSKLDAYEIYQELSANPDLQQYTTPQAKALFADIKKLNQQEWVQELVGKVETAEDAEGLRQALLDYGRIRWEDTPAYQQLADEHAQKMFNDRFAALSTKFSEKELSDLVDWLNDSYYPDLQKAGIVGENGMQKFQQALIALDDDVLMNLKNSYETMKGEGSPQLFRTFFRANENFKELAADLDVVEQTAGPEQAEQLAMLVAAGRITSEDVTLVRDDKKTIELLSSSMNDGQKLQQYRASDFLVQEEGPAGIPITRLDSAKLEQVRSELRNVKTSAKKVRLFGEALKTGSMQRLLSENAERDAMVRQAQEQEAQRVAAEEQARQAEVQQRAEQLSQQPAEAPQTQEVQNAAGTETGAPQGSTETGTQGSQEERVRVREQADAGVPEERARTEKALTQALGLLEGKVDVTKTGEGWTLTLADGSTVAVTIEDLPGRYAAWSPSERKVRIAPRTGDASRVKLTHEILHMAGDLGIIADAQLRRLAGLSAKVLTGAQIREVLQAYGVTKGVEDILRKQKAMTKESIVKAVLKAQDAGDLVHELAARTVEFYDETRKRPAGNSRTAVQKVLDFVDDLVTTLRGSQNLTNKERTILDQLRTGEALKAKPSKEGGKGERASLVSKQRYQSIDEVAESKLGDKNLGFIDASGKYREKIDGLHVNTAEALGYTGAAAVQNMLKGTKAIRLGGFGQMGEIETPADGNWEPTAEQVQAVQDWLARRSGAAYTARVDASRNDASLQEIRDKLIASAMKSDLSRASKVTGSKFKSLKERFEAYKQSVKGQLKTEAARHSVPRPERVTTIRRLGDMVAKYSKANQVADLGVALDHVMDNILNPDNLADTPKLKDLNRQYAEAKKASDEGLMADLRSQIKETRQDVADQARDELLAWWKDLRLVGNSLEGLTPEQAKIVAESHLNTALGEEFTSLLKNWSQSPANILKRLGTSVERRMAENVKAEFAKFFGKKGLMRSRDMQYASPAEQQLMADLTDDASVAAAEKDFGKMVEAIGLARELDTLTRKTVLEYRKQLNEENQAYAQNVADNEIPKGFYKPMKSPAGQTSLTEPSLATRIQRSGNSAVMDMKLTGMDKTAATIEVTRDNQLNYDAKMQSQRDALYKESGLTPTEQDDWHSTFEDVTPKDWTGEKIFMTPFQRTALRAYSLDPDAWAKILANGWNPYTDRDSAAAIPGFVAAQVVADTRVPEAQRVKEEKIAVGLMEIMGEFARTEGNAASKKAIGVERFGEGPHMTLIGAIKDGKTHEVGEFETALLEGAPTRNANVANAGVQKARVEHTHPILIQDADALFRRWSTAMSTYAAWAPEYSRIMTTLKNPKVSEELVTRLGKSGAQGLTDFIRILTNQQPIQRTDAMSKIFNKIANGLSVRRLAFSPGVWAQNRFLGKLAYYYQLKAEGHNDLAAAYLKQWSGYKELKMSDADQKILDKMESIAGYLYKRWDRSVYSRMAGDLTYSERGQTASQSSEVRKKISNAMKNLTEYAMHGMVVAEQKNAVELYKTFIKSGMPEAKAASEVARLTRRTQNPSDALDTSKTYMSLQAAPWVRLFAPFLGQATTTNLNLRRNILEAAQAVNPDLSGLDGEFSSLLKQASKEGGESQILWSSIGYLSQMVGASIITAMILKLRDREKEWERGKLSKKVKELRRNQMITNNVSNFLDQALPGSGKAFDALYTAYEAVLSKGPVNAESIVAPSLLSSVARDVVAVKDLTDRRKRRKISTYYNVGKKALSEVLPVQGLFSIGEAITGAGGYGYDIMKELDKQSKEGMVE